MGSKFPLSLSLTVFLTQFQTPLWDFTKWSNGLNVCFNSFFFFQHVSKSLPKKWQETFAASQPPLFFSLSTSLKFSFLFYCTKRFKYRHYSSVFFLLLSNIFGNFVVLWYTTSRHSLSIDILVLTLLTSYILSNPRAIRANLSSFQPFHKSHFFPSKIFSLTPCMDVGSIRPKNINIFHPIYMWFLKFYSPFLFHINLV